MVAHDRSIIAVTGYSGTGKTTLCDYLEAEHGFVVCEGSTYIKEYAGKLGVQLSSRDSFAVFHRQQQQIRGMSWVSDITLAGSDDRVAHSGLRSRSDFLQLQRHGAAIVALVCPPEIAVLRLDTSNPKNASTIEEYRRHMQLEESADEYGTHTQWCVDNAEYKIDSSGSIDSVYEQADEIVATVIRSRA